MLPEFKARDALREAQKQAELAPYHRSRRWRASRAWRRSIRLTCRWFESSRTSWRGGRTGEQHVRLGPRRRDFPFLLPDPRAAVSGSADDGGAMLTGISAITLATHDMARAVAFYQALGFMLKSGGSAAAIHQLPCRQRLSEPDADAGGARVVLVGPRDLLVHIDVQHARACAAGLSPHFAPRDAPWGERYFHMADPDGHELSFARPL